MAKKMKLPPGEQARELYNSGMSERDATLVSLKRTKKDKKKSEKTMTVGPMSEDYPYSTRIDLDEEELDKLGIDELPAAGDTLTMKAKVKVKRSSESSNDDDQSGKQKRRSLCLQITDMSLDCCEDDEGDDDEE